VRLNIASALHPGSENVVVAKAHAQRGAAVKISISD
jgi:hypothetical protein